MNAKKVKKMRQQTRRAAQEFMPTMLRPRPKWMPRIMWRQLAKLFFR